MKRPPKSTIKKKKPLGMSMEERLATTDGGPLLFALHQSYMENQLHQDPFKCGHGAEDWVVRDVCRRDLHERTAKHWGRLLRLPPHHFPHSIDMVVDCYVRYLRKAKREDIQRVMAFYGAWLKTPGLLGRRVNPDVLQEAAGREALVGSITDGEMKNQPRRDLAEAEAGSDGSGDEV